MTITWVVMKDCSTPPAMTDADDLEVTKERVGLGKLAHDELYVHFLSDGQRLSGRTYRVDDVAYVQIGGLWNGPNQHPHLKLEFAPNTTTAL